MIAKITLTPCLVTGKNCYGTLRLTCAHPYPLPEIERMELKRAKFAPTEGRLCKAVGITDRGVLEPIELMRRRVTDFDVGIEIKFAGICHSGKVSVYE
jgi:hypothetical protein